MAPMVDTVWRLLEILSFALWLGLEFYGSMAKCCFWA